MEKSFRTALDRYCEKKDVRAHMLKREIGNLLYPNSSNFSRTNNMNNLFNGKKRNIPLAHLRLLCEKLEVSPNELLGYPETNEAQLKLNKILEVINQ
jgi:DNA-binding Xre family transcriptional regulator